MLRHLPNLLTLSRIAAVPLLALLLWNHGWPGWLLAFILYCIAGVTDYLDGYLARAQGTVSRLGQFLDPIADKLMVAAVIVLLLSARVIDGVHVVPAMVIVLREIAVSGLREVLAQLSVSMPVSRLAKWKTTAQMVALGALLLSGASHAFWPALPAWEIGMALLWVAALLTLITGYDYLRAGLRHLE